MLSKNKISLITSLKYKKFRDKHGLFIAEGEKIVCEIIDAGFKIPYLIFDKNQRDYNHLNNVEEFIDVEEVEMKKISQLKTPSSVLAVVETRELNSDINSIKQEICMAFDDIQNPGNLGTIVRTCDWFGIKNIFLSKNSVDIYSPKTIQASAGAFLRVNVHYVDLVEFLENYSKNINNCTYGTFLDGENVYSADLADKGLIVFGNEGQGISPEVANKINRKLLIPSFAKNSQQSESLNIAAAVAVICSEIKRRQH